MLYHKLEWLFSLLLKLFLLVKEAGDTWWPHAFPLNPTNDMGPWADFISIFLKIWFAFSFSLSRASNKGLIWWDRYPGWHKLAWPVLRWFWWSQFSLHWLNVSPKTLPQNGHYSIWHICTAMLLQAVWGVRERRKSVRLLTFKTNFLNNLFMFPNHPCYFALLWILSLCGPEHTVWKLKSRELGIPCLLTYWYWAM